MMCGNGWMMRGYLLMANQVCYSLAESSVGEC